MNYKLLSREIIVELHEIILEESGGRPGILHLNVIDSAVNRPLRWASYNENSNIHTICALVIDSLARNHAFVEGNKRTALIAMLFTYRINGYYLSYSSLMNNDYEELALWVVNTKPDIIEIESKLRKLFDKYGTSGYRGALSKLLGK